MLRFAMEENDRNKMVSALTQIEARSAIARLRREKIMTPVEAALAITSIEDELRRIVEQPMNSPVIDAAITLLDRHALRALDAVQLASALVVRSLSDPEVRFIASDTKLIEAARLEGFPVWNPSS